MLVSRLLYALIAAAPLLATAADAAPARATRSFHDYGPRTRQALDLYLPEGKRPAPLILFIHGGGWSEGSKEMGEGIQPTHFVQQGFAWAAMNYRYVPNVGVQDQAADVARAIGWLVKNARRFRLDPEHVVLISHSSGAHLAALVGSDPRYLKAAGVPENIVRGVISLDGTAFDVPAMMEGGAAQSPFFAKAFGIKAEAWKDVSPMAYAENAPVRQWLFFYDQYHNPPAGQLATMFAARLSAAGAQAQIVPVSDTTHMRMLGELGAEGDVTTRTVDIFLSRLLALPKAEMPKAAAPDPR